jgi:hypothetical protein
MDRTDLSGLSDSTTYYFYLNETEYSITTGTSPTYEDVNNLIHSAISGDGYESVIVGVTPNEDIRVKDIARRGSESKVVMDSGVSGPDLFTNLNGFTSLEEPVSGGGGVEQAEYIPIPSGGLTIGGNSPADSVEVIETGSGQVLTAGSSPADSIEVIETGSGQTLIAGNSPADSVEVIETGSGQSLMDGTATYSYTTA